MRIRFWGVRGSIPAPGPHTVRYGGNTTCIEVRSDGGALIILDAGTGIFPLAQKLLAEMPIEAHVFITHTHWDHIHGLPFFTPLYVPGNKVILYGAYDLVHGVGIEQVMSVQMQYSFFPINAEQVESNVDYQTLQVGKSVAVRDVTVTPVLLNHPVPNFGYRLDCGGRSLFFTGDHEPWRNLYSPGDAEYADCQALVDARQAAFVEAIRGVDLLICDAAYSEEEYSKRIGWGHGTHLGALDLARQAGARRVVLTHHEPTRSDDELERVFAEAVARCPTSAAAAMLAREGMEIDL